MPTKKKSAEEVEDVNTNENVLTTAATALVVLQDKLSPAKDGAVNEQDNLSLAKDTARNQNF